MTAADTSKLFVTEHQIKDAGKFGQFFGEVLAPMKNVSVFDAMNHPKFGGNHCLLTVASGDMSKVRNGNTHRADVIVVVVATRPLFSWSRYLNCSHRSLPVTVIVIVVVILLDWFLLFVSVRIFFSQKGNLCVAFPVRESHTRTIPSPCRSIYDGRIRVGVRHQRRLSHPGHVRGRQYDLRELLQRYFVRGRRETGIRTVDPGEGRVLCVPPQHSESRMGSTDGSVVRCGRGRRWNRGWN